jgi:hypothetical protein
MVGERLVGLADKGRMVGERLIGLVEDFSYVEQFPKSTSFTSIPQSHCLQNQYSLLYEGINTGIGEPEQ